VLHTATSKNQLHFPGSGFHQLQPKGENRYAMKVDRRFRITFTWDDANGDALRVNLEDYH
jgi:plasmid maintenance system killer protein